MLQHEDPALGRQDDLGEGVLVEVADRRVAVGDRDAVDGRRVAPQDLARPAPLPAVRGVADEHLGPAVEVEIDHQRVGAPVPALPGDRARPEEAAFVRQDLAADDDLRDAVAVEVGDRGRAPARGQDRVARPLEGAVVLEGEEPRRSPPPRADDLGTAVGVDVGRGQAAAAVQSEGRVGDAPDLAPVPAAQRPQAPVVGVARAPGVVPWATKRTSGMASPSTSITIGAFRTSVDTGSTLVFVQPHSRATFQPRRGTRARRSRATSCRSCSPRRPPRRPARCPRRRRRGCRRTRRRRDRHLDGRGAARLEARHLLLAEDRVGAGLEGPARVAVLEDGEPEGAEGRPAPGFASDHDPAPLATSERGSTTSRPVSTCRTVRSGRAPGDPTKTVASSADDRSPSLAVSRST